MSRSYIIAAKNQVVQILGYLQQCFLWILHLLNSVLGRVVHCEQSSSIAIKLTFAPPQINKITMTIFGASMWTFTYSNDPKFSDRYAWANSADPDQTAPRGAV